MRLYKNKKVIGDCTLYLGDCLDILPTLPKVDAVVTDPPYNVDFKYENFEDKRDDYKAWLAGILSSTAAKSIIYTPGTMNILDPLLIHGYRPIRLLGWHRKEFAGDKWINGPAMTWEPICWYSKEEKPFYNKIFGHAGRDFYIVNDVKTERQKIDHPCPKPLAVMNWLVNLFTEEKWIILDPFMGSGTTGVACVKRHRKFIGIEIEEKYFDVACKRIEEAYKQPDLFIEQKKAEQLEFTE